MTTIRTMTAGMAMAAALTLPAAAQQQPPPQQQQTQQQPSPPQAEAERPKLVRLSGTVEQIRDVPIRGSDQTNRVALVRTQSGQTLPVDLGPVAALQGIDLQKGAEIMALGDFGRVGNRLVVFASDLRAGDQALTIERPQTAAAGPGREQAGQQQIPSAYAIVAGEVVKMKDVKVRGAPQPNTAALIRTESGGFIVADLGTAETVRDRVQAQQPIVVRGHFAGIQNGRLVLMADAMRVGEQTLFAERPAPTVQAMIEASEQQARQEMEDEMQQDQPPQ